MIPSSKFQKRIHQTEKNLLSPGAAERFIASGILLEVWDQQKLSSQEVPPVLLDILRRAPGALYGLVSIGQTRKYLPFKDSEELIYMVHGNGVNLEGKKVKIEFGNTNIDNGRIILLKNIEQQHIDLITDLKVLDIGGII